MRNFPRFLWLAAMLAACSLHPSPTPELVAESSPSRDFGSLLRVSRILRLQNQGLALGVIKKVVQTPAGELFVSDAPGSGRIYRFDSNGQFLRDYGPPATDGQSKPPKPVDFQADGRSVLVLTQRQLFRLNGESGEPESSVAVQPYPLYLTARGDTACVLSTTGGVQCFDQHLRPTVRVAGFENAKLDKYIYTAFNGMEFWGDGQLAVAFLYSPDVMLVDTSRGTARVIRFPGSEESTATLDPLWARSRLTPTDEAEIRANVRRMVKVFRLPDQRLLLYDTRNKDDRRDVIVLNTQSLMADRFDRHLADIPVGPTGIRRNTLDLVVGADERYLIGAIPNDEIAANMSARFPVTSECKGAWQCLFFLDIEIH